MPWGTGEDRRNQRGGSQARPVRRDVGVPGWWRVLGPWGWAHSRVLRVRGGGVWHLRPRRSLLWWLWPDPCVVGGVWVVAPPGSSTSASRRQPAYTA